MDKVRVLIVDDSTFFRKRIRTALELAQEIEIVGEAVNGREAVEMAARLKPDLITMDVAMPVMDGIAAVRKIMRDNPTNIIMFSSLTGEGARATLDALDAGAVDFLTKQVGINGEREAEFGRGLCNRVIDITRNRQIGGKTVSPLRAVAEPALPKRASGRFSTQPKLVLIGASTGGPVALQRVLARLPASYPYPVVAAVHMPAEFTPTFAERLDSVCSISVRHAQHGDLLVAGQVLVAPGGRQAMIERHGNRMRVVISDAGDQIYKPSVDILFGSAARSIGGGILGVVLTGMGADGTDGARLLKDRGSMVWGQDQLSSVVYGMPHAVAKAGLTDRVLPLEEIGEALSGLA